MTFIGGYISQYRKDAKLKVKNALILILAHAQEDIGERAVEDDKRGHNRNAHAHRLIIEIQHANGVFAVCERTCAVACELSRFAVELCETTRL